MQERPHATVAAIVQREDRFLLVHEESDGQVVYNQPAGHLDPGESLLDAVVRETLEETAWEIRPLALVGLYTYHSPLNGISYLRVCFAAEPVREMPGRALDEGVLAAPWKTLPEIETLARNGDLRSPLVLHCIRDHLAGAHHPLSLVQEV